MRKELRPKAFYHYLGVVWSLLCEQVFEVLEDRDSKLIEDSFLEDFNKHDK